MRPGNLFESIIMVKLFADILSEGESSASGTNIVAIPIIRVAPQQIAHAAFVRHFLLPV